MPNFLNPNNPEQPQKGIYQWFFMSNNQKVVLYIGQSEEKPNIGTLKKGVDEIHCTPSHRIQNEERYIHVNYIVGNIIKIIEKKTQSKCYWEHISDKPTELFSIGLKNKPILQERTEGILLLKPGISSLFNLEEEPFYNDSEIKLHLKMMGLF